MNLRVCKVTGRLDIDNLAQGELEKLVKTKTITEVTAGNQVKYYVSPFKYPEIEQNPTLNCLFGRKYPRNWRHGPFNPTNLDVTCNSELVMESIRKWTDLTYPKC